MAVVNPAPANPDRRRPLRVLHVLPDLDLGGGQQVLRRLVAGMDPGRFQHVVCYYDPVHAMREAFESAGATVHHLPRAGWWSWLRNQVQTVRLVRRERIDIVHVNGTPLDKVHGQIAALLCGKPVVSTLHGPRWQPRAPWWVMRLRIRELCERVIEPWTVRRVVAVSDEVLDSWRPYLESRGVPPERMLVSRNGVPTLEFAPEARTAEIARLRQELAADGASPLLVTVGRIDANKAHRHLIPVMERVRERWPGARLFVVGEGPLEAALRAEIDERSLSEQIVLLGRRSDVPALLGMCDLFVFTSLSEGLPLAVLEAMSAGLPVAAFRLPGLAGVVEEGVHGFQVAPRDCEALARRVIELLADPERARRMGRAGRRRAVEEYDVAESVRRFERVVEEVGAP